MKTVDKIIGQFTKTVAALETAAQQNSDAEVKAIERVRLARQAADNYGREATRARKLAENINKLLEV